MQIWPNNPGGSIKRLAEWAERHPGIVALILTLLYCAFVFKRALQRPLWHDELFTLYIAQSRTLAEMWRVLRTVDLNPPLSCVLARAALAAFKPPMLACRIPSMLAFLVASLLLFSFLKRKTTAIYASLGVLLLWNSRFFDYATEARPYALMLAFTTIMLLGWQHATRDGRRWPSLLILTFGGFGLLLSHVFGICALAAFWLAEAVRCYLRRKCDWALWACLSLPLIGCITYLPLIHTQSVALYPPQWQPSVERTTLMYQNQVQAVFLPLLIMLLLAAAWRRKPSTRMFPLNIPECVLLVGLLLELVEVSLLLARSHGALAERYGIMVVIPLTVLPVLTLAWGSRCNAMAGVLLTAYLILSLYVPPRVIAVEELPTILSPKQTAQVVQWVFPLPLAERPVKYLDASYGTSRSEPPVRLRGGLDDVQPELPIVAASPSTFLEMDNREGDKIVRRLYYLTDREAATQIAHHTLFESYAELKRVFPIRATIERYQDFVRAYPRFLVIGTYGYPGDWLLQKLQADGATARLAWRLELAYKDKDVYEISMPPEAPAFRDKLASAKGDGAAGSNGTFTSAASGRSLPIPSHGGEADIPAASTSLVALGNCRGSSRTKLPCASSPAGHAQRAGPSTTMLSPP